MWAGRGRANALGPWSTTVDPPSSAPRLTLPLPWDPVSLNPTSPTQRMADCRSLDEGVWRIRRAEQAHHPAPLGRAYSGMDFRTK